MREQERDPAEYYVPGVYRSKRPHGWCKVCHRKLTNEESVMYGIGPICITRYPGLANVKSEQEADEFLDRVEREEREAKELAAREHQEKMKAYMDKIAEDRKSADKKSHFSLLYAAKNELSHYKDRDFRQYQAEAIDFILKSENKFVFLEAPTGSGKSLIAMVAGLANGGVTYSVHTKILQQQITDDFPEAKSLFGRSNYKCLNGTDRGMVDANCGDCVNEYRFPCVGCPDPDRRCGECATPRKNSCQYKSTNQCEYEAQKKLVLKSKLRIINYDYLLAETNYVGNFSNSDFNIIDEADNLENTLVGFVSLEFSAYALSRLGLIKEAESLQMSSVDKEFLASQWKTFGESASNIAKRMMNDLDHQIKRMEDSNWDEKKKLIRQRDQFTHLMEKIGLFLDNFDDTWLLDMQWDETVDPTGHAERKLNKLIWRPLWMTEGIANQFLWRHAKKWVLMSASFLPVHIEAKRLGIPADEYDYKCMPSTFPIERRQIYIEPIANITAKDFKVEVPKLISGIRTILDEHPNVKGLIHGVSYKLSNEIVRGLNSPRILVHGSKDRQDVLKTFKESPKPLVLVSPSMERGVSLEMDLCRFIIVAKAPFLYLGDKIVSARVYGSGNLGQEWYAATMLCTVLQMTGRGMRSADDFCETYILDSNFRRVYFQRQLFLPQWWKDAVVDKLSW